MDETIKKSVASARAALDMTAQPGVSPQESVTILRVALQQTVGALASLAGDQPVSPAPRRLAHSLANAGTAWTTEDLNRLVDLWNSGMRVNAIAREMRRTSGAISSRLVREGLVSSKSDARKAIRHDEAGLQAGLFGSSAVSRGLD